MKPGDSVFVQAKEWIFLPNNMVAKVYLKNSRIRQGLTLDAPLYQPGHQTPVFFRITNVSHSILELSNTDTHGIAYVVFEQLESDVANPYNGTFQQEKVFRGMANYEKDYSKEMNEIDEKIDAIHNL